MKRPTLAVALGLIGAVASADSVRDAAKPLSARLTDRLEEMRCPGAVVGVVPDRRRGVVFGVGHADAATTQPMRPEMRMRIGSVSKLFVGAVVLLLADKGVLSLDDPVAEYVSGVPHGDEITVRMLGQHTSGLACPIWNDGFQAEILDEPRKQWSARALLERAADLPMHHEPGHGWHYSNTAATVAGLVAERAGGEPYERLLAELVCKPLGLRCTGLCEQPAPPEPAPRAYRHGRGDRWLGYGETFCDVTDYSASWAGVGGNMYSTVQDLCVATRSFATGRLLSDESRGELLAWRESGWEGVDAGFFINRNRRGVGHEGNVPGFQAVARYQPTRQRTVVVLTNLSNNADGSMPAEQLFDLVAEHLESPPAHEAAAVR